LLLPDKGNITWGMIDRGTAVPPWRQLAAILRGKIESGEYAPGSRLPSALALAEAYQVAYPTARKALNALKAEGLTEGVPGYGTFVAQPK
jgi:DNA-binding GntR family transcriptional regulator